MRLLYSACLYLILPLVLLRLLLQSRQQSGYRRGLGQRFGCVQLPSERPVIWLHAVSAGEVVAAVPVIRFLLSEHVEYQLLVTTTTPAGLEVLRRHFGERVEHLYAPWDLPGSITRFMQRAQPQLVLLMETELWPNWLSACDRAGVPVLLLNARLSARSMRRYQRVPGFAREVLGRVDHVLCQSDADAERFAALGVSKQALTITGSTKMQAALDQEALTIGSELRTVLAPAGASPGRIVVAACSIQEAELDAVLEGFSELRERFENSVLLLAPRRFERADAIAARCRRAGYDVALRSTGELPGDAGAILLIDTIGELAALLGAAQSAFVGGSLVPHGGQNPVEPARWGVPVLSGPHTQNFADICSRLEAAGGLATVTDGASLGAWWVRLAEDDQLAARMGEAARNAVEEGSGAMAVIAPLLRQRLVAG